MLASLIFLFAFTADEPTFNNLKLSEWVAMSKDDPLPRKRKAAVQALGQLVTEKTKDTVLTAVSRAMRNDSQASVRLQAAKVLNQQPAETMAGYIAELSESLRQEKDAEVRTEIAVGLGRIGKAAQAAVLPLIDALKDDPVVKAAAANALGKIGPGAHAAAGTLIPLTKHADRAVRQAAVFALGRIEPADPDAAVASINSLLGDLTQKHRAITFRSGLAGGLASSAREGELAAASVISLGLLGVKTNEVVRALAEQFADPDPDVRQQSALALGKLAVAARGAETELKSALKNDTDKQVRIYSAHALAAGFALDPDALIAIFAERMKSEPDFEVRIAMVDELGTLGPAGNSALPALREAQRDTQVKVREAASLAIRRITKPTPPEIKP